MRKLLIYILLFCSLKTFAQVDYFTLIRTTGTRAGFVEYRTPANPNGKLNPVMLWLHGVDGNRSAPVTPADTTRIAVVTDKGPLRLVRGGTPLPLFQKPGTVGAEDRYSWNVVAPQNPFSGSNLWAEDVIDLAMDYIRANPEKWDTSLIVIVGYSLGGRAVKTAVQRAKILPYVKYVVDISGGTTAGTSTSLQTYADSGIPWDFFISKDDELVDENQTDIFVNGIKSRNPKVVPNHVKFVDITQSTTFPVGGTMHNPEHDFIEWLIARDTTNGDTETTTNGDTWTKSENIYQRGLRFFGPRRMRLIPFLIVFVPRRRRSQKTKTCTG